MQYMVQTKEKIIELQRGLEPPTLSLGGIRSTIELLERIDGGIV